MGYRFGGVRTRWLSWCEDFRFCILSVCGVDAVCTAKTLSFAKMNLFGQLVTQKCDVYNNSSCTQQDFDCLTQYDKGARMLMMENSGEKVISRVGQAWRSHGTLGRDTAVYKLSIGGSNRTFDKAFTIVRRPSSSPLTRHPFGSLDRHGLTSV